MWNYGQNNRDRQWYGNNNYNNNNPREGQLAIYAAGDAEGSGQTRMSRNTNNSAISKRSYNWTSNSERVGNRPTTTGQLHNIQEDDANFSQSASSNLQDN